MAAATTAASQASFWTRRNVALILSPVGLLLISVTRLLIVADYNTTTAIAIASSGGYVNTLLGTVIPLVPIILPYLAIALLIFRRFVLSTLTFGATLLVTPTRLAPLTALNSFKGDWHRVVVLVSGHLLLSIFIIGTLLIIDLSAFTRTFGRGSFIAITLALLATAFLLPYVLYVYPFPPVRNPPGPMPNYYAEFMRQPWLPAEHITVKSGVPIVGYALTEDDHWMVVLKAAPRIIHYIPAGDVTSRSVCQVNSQESKIPQSPVVPLLNPKSVQLPSCWGPSPAPAPAAHEVKGYAGMCADDSGNSSGPRTKILIWKCSSSDAAQSWKYSGDKLIHDGKCMNDKASRGSGSPIILYTCNGAPDELWTHNSHGEYVLKAHGSTLCLDDPAYSTKNGAQLIVYTCKDSANQQWSLP